MGFVPNPGVVALPSSFSVENYRSFSRRQNIDIRPLTLFFGWNSGGKSALVRFLPLLAESIRIGGPPIWLGGEVGRGATWPELVCLATKRDALQFAMEWQDSTLLKAEWEIKGGVDGQWQEIERLRVDGARPASFDNPAESRGLIPTFEHTDIEQKMSVGELDTHLEALVSDVQWISGIRARPPRIATYAGGIPRTLRSDGEDAIYHLIAAKMRSVSDPLIAIVQAFFRTLGEEIVLDSPARGLWQVLLHPLGAPGVRVNLCDTGEGYAQVLPVLVALARACTGGPRLLCLEQPELHLHTRAQQALATVMVQLALSSSSPRLLVETHSEVLLMSVQLAIARGEIAPDQVRVYWIESRGDGTSDVVAVDFDAMGRPTNSTLASAFEEATRIGRELVRIQLTRRKP